MKTLNSLKYILFSMIVLGIFANWAQNSYGNLEIYLSLMILAYVFITEAVLHLKNKRSIIYLYSFYICSVLTLVLGNFKPLLAVALILWFTSFLLILSEYVVILFKWKKTDKNKVFLSLESLFIMMFITGFLFKVQHYFGANIVMVLSSFFISLVYIVRGLKILLYKKDTSLLLRWFALGSFLFITICYFVPFTLRMMHWFFWIYFYFLGLTLLILVWIIPLFIRKKFRIKEEKIRISKYLWSFKGNARLLTIIVIVSTFHTLGIFHKGIVPDFYSIRFPPATEKMGDRKYRIYIDNFTDFLDNRAKADEKNVNSQ